MSIVMEYLRDMIGIPPEGYEFLEYFGALIFFLIIFQFLTDLFRNVASFLNLRR